MHHSYHTTALKRWTCHGCLLYLFCRQGEPADSFHCPRLKLWTACPCGSTGVSVQQRLSVPYPGGCGCYVLLHAKHVPAIQQCRKLICSSTEGTAPVAFSELAKVVDVSARCQCELWLLFLHQGEERLLSLPLSRCGGGYTTGCGTAN